jgi:hypothetical protein
MEGSNLSLPLSQSRQLELFRKLEVVGLTADLVDKIVDSPDDEVVRKIVELVHDSTPNVLKQIDGLKMSAIDIFRAADNFVANNADGVKISFLGNYFYLVNTECCYFPIPFKWNIARNLFNFC